MSERRCGEGVLGARLWRVKSYIGRQKGREMAGGPFLWMEKRERKVTVTCGKEENRRGRREGHRSIVPFFFVLFSRRYS